MYNDYLILGGAGLVGLQVCRHIVRRLEPSTIVVASLTIEEATAATPPAAGHAARRCGWDEGGRGVVRPVVRDLRVGVRFQKPRVRQSRGYDIGPKDV